MFFFNLTFGQFLVLFTSASALMIALYLLDRSRRRQVVSTLQFWVASQQPAIVLRRKRIQQPWSLLLQLVSVALLLLAISQLRFGHQDSTPRHHVLILDTSAWMAARSGRQTLMQQAAEQARAYLRALPAGDRVMLVRADALATPATAFEPNRAKVEEAIAASKPGATALNIDQALAFARQSQSNRRAGEIVFVGAGRIDSSVSPPPSAVPGGNLRVLAIPDNIENCGLRKMGLRRSTIDPELWDVFVSVRNYGTRPKQVTLHLTFGGALAASRQLNLPPGADREVTFEYRTRAAGLLEATLIPGDSFPADDHAVLELPRQRGVRVTVYTEHPELLRPLLAANPRVAAVFKRPAEYSPASDTLVVIDRFRPQPRPQSDAIWIDPPADGSPIPMGARVTDAPFARWNTHHPLGAGLWTKDVRLESATVFQAAPDDVRIGEVEKGPVIVARATEPKQVVFGFHPGLAAMRFELATPLLFANILQWMAPDAFRHWELNAGGVGAVRLSLDADIQPEQVRILRDDGTPVPFTTRDRSVNFFTATPGTVRVIAGNRESVYSLTLPQMWEAKWQPPPDARRGIPTHRDAPPSSQDLWPWLALLGAAGLILEWFLYGRFGRGSRALRAPVSIGARVRKAS